MTFELIDVHVHLGVSSVLSVAGSADEILRKMELNGIHKSVISPIPGYEDPNGVPDSAVQNDGIAKALKDHPEQLVRGLGVVEPRHGKAALDEVDRVMEGLGLSGLMFHNDFNGLPVDHPTMYAILERLAKYPNAVAQVHTAQHSVLEAPFQLGRIARAFPGITFLNAHPFMDTTHEAASLDLGENHPNIVFDTAVSHTQLYPIEHAVERLGADRILWASSNPYYETTLDIPLVMNSNFGDDVKAKLFSENAKRIFNL